MQPRKLEEYKYFQPIAWTICLSFAGFVAILSFQLKGVVHDLQSSSISMEQRLQDLEREVFTDENGNVIGY